MQNYTGLMIYFALATYWSLMGLLPRCQSRRRQALFSARLAPNPPWLARCTYILGGALLTNALFLDLMFWAFLFNWSSGNFFGSLFKAMVCPSSPVSLRYRHSLFKRSNEPSFGAERSCASSFTA